MLSVRRVCVIIVAHANRTATDEEFNATVQQDGRGHDASTVSSKTVCSRWFYRPMVALGLRNGLARTQDANNGTKNHVRRQRA